MRQVINSEKRVGINFMEHMFYPPIGEKWRNSESNKSSFPGENPCSENELRSCYLNSCY